MLLIFTCIAKIILERLYKNFEKMVYKVVYGLKLVENVRKVVKTFFPKLCAIQFDNTYLIHRNVLQGSFFYPDYSLKTFKLFYPMLQI